MMKRHILLLLTGAIVLLHTTGLLAVIVYNSGDGVTIYDMITEEVHVTNSDEYNPQGMINIPTTVSFAAGGGISGGEYDTQGFWVTYGAKVYLNSEIRIIPSYDYNEQGQLVYIGAGSIAGGIRAHDDSKINILDGNARGGIEMHDNSRITVSGGEIEEWLCTYQNATATISGGTLLGSLLSFDNSRISVTGGTIASIGAEGTSCLTLYGNFDGHEFGTLTGTGNLTGNLANGDPLSIDYYTLNDGQIILAPIPEPVTYLLFTIGFAILRTKKQ